MRKLAIASKAWLLGIAAVFLTFPPPSVEAQTTPAKQDTWPTIRRVIKEGAGGSRIYGSPSTDGRFFTIVDLSRLQVGLLELATGETRFITERPPQGSTEWPYYQPLMSPDGELVVYPNYKRGEVIGSQLRLVEVDGPPSRELYYNPDLRTVTPKGWSPDAKTILVTISRGDGTTAIGLVSVDDGSLRVLTTLGWQGANASFSPDGKWIAFDFPSDENSASRDINILAADGSRQTSLIAHPANDFLSGWTPDGSAILFASDRSGTPCFWAVRVADGTPQGDPVLVRPDVWGLIEGGIGFTGDGAFFYRVRSGEPEVYTVTLELESGAIITPPAKLSVRRRIARGSSIQWSPDGRYLAFLADRGPAGTYRSREPAIVIWSTATGEDREITPSLSYISAPVWSHDGQSFLIGGVNEKNQSGLYRVDGLTGNVTTLARDSLPRDIERASDGKTIYYHDRNRAGTGVFKHDLESGVVTGLHVTPGRLASGSQTEDPEYLFRDLALSPDDRYLALRSYFDNAVLIMDTSGGSPREIYKLSEDEWTRSITKLVWTEDGEHILFTTETVKGSELWRVAAEGGEAVKISSAFPATGIWELHPDGKQIVYFRGPISPVGKEIWVMEDFLPIDAVRTSRLQR